MSAVVKSQIKFCRIRVQFVSILAHRTFFLLNTPLVNIPVRLLSLESIHLCAQSTGEIVFKRLAYVSRAAICTRGRKRLFLVPIYAHNERFRTCAWCVRTFNFSARPPRANGRFSPFVLARNVCALLVFSLPFSCTPLYFDVSNFRGREREMVAQSRRGGGKKNGSS